VGMEERESHVARQGILMIGSVCAYVWSILLGAFVQGWYEYEYTYLGWEVEVCPFGCMGPDR
jgi:hypothetical protein